MATGQQGLHTDSDPRGTVLPPALVCERARRARDARFDGLFFTAVTSTGIYCRPICPAPAALSRNVRYFATAAAASAAGFRPCLRCRPELAPNAMAHRLGEALVDRALSMIADGALQHESVDALARRLGISDRHLRRLLLAHAGATPQALHATQRLLLAKQLLTETTLPVTQVALAAGFGSVRRFNDVFSASCGMAPGRLRRGLNKRSAQGLALRLAYRPPLDFDAMLAFLARRALPGIERVTPETYERLHGDDPQRAQVRVSAIPNRAELRLELIDVDAREIPDLVRRVRRVFDLDADLRTVHEVLRTEPLLAEAIERRPGLRVPGGWAGFEVAVRAILGQQVSVTAATTLAARLVTACREVAMAQASTPDRTWLTPDTLLHVLKGRVGLPGARVAALRALAEAVAAGRIDFSAGQVPAAFIAGLTALPGIGPWTAQYVAMRALGQPDAFPASDLVIRQVLGRAQGDGRALRPPVCEARSQAWRPWRAYAVIHLWHLAADTQE